MRTIIFGIKLWFLHFVTNMAHGEHSIENYMEIRHLIMWRDRRGRGRCWLRCQRSRTECTTMANITDLWHTDHKQTQRSGDDGVMHDGFFSHFTGCIFFCCFFFHSANMCNTFTVHHKANRLHTQRHMVKTDVWLSWASRGVTFLISDPFINLNIKRSDKSDSEIRFVSCSSKEARCKWLSHRVGWLSPSCGLGWNWCYR